MHATDLWECIPKDLHNCVNKSCKEARFSIQFLCSVPDSSPKNASQDITGGE